jgi:dolichyl-phosphate-mannose-protein mannosyltransferase
VHFGKFASHYIQREYYFDVHPPFAKLLFGLAGWFVGFDGNFKFDNIGDSYTDSHVPYVGMRSLAAIMGSLTIPVVYAIMKESGFSTIVAAFSASLILFGALKRTFCTVDIDDPFIDNAHIAQSRLILLDAALIFFMSLTIYAYIRFRKLRYWCVVSHCSMEHVLITFSQGVYSSMVGMARRYRCTHGLHMGFKSQRYPYRRHHRHRGSHRSLGCS